MASSTSISPRILDSTAGLRISVQALLWPALVLAALTPYFPFLNLPFISDDYLQILLGRTYGPISNWGELASDALYRCRATSIVVTYALDQVFGPDASTHRLASFALHTFNSFLVAALGRWNRIGWRTSVPAAIFFALSEGHQEAVIWTAALPELLVFTFSMLSLLTWLEWLHRRSPAWLLCSLACFLLALLSKESGVIVVPLAAFAWILESRKWRLPLAVLAGMICVVAIYVLGIYYGRATHLHLHDGTFSLGAPFVRTLAISTGRMILPWGLASLIILRWGRRADSTLLLIAAVWIVITLLPYSFLTYNDRVPSRHTYFASVGLALLVGAAVIALWKRAGRTAVAALTVAIIIHSSAYLWTKKLDQYRRRADPTERFLQFAVQSDAPIRIHCAPYGYKAFQHAALVRLGRPSESVIGPDDKGDESRLRIFCDTSKP